MKKIVLMLLVLSLLCLVGCKSSNDGDGSNASGGSGNTNVEQTDVARICETAKKSNPTRVVTDVTYLTNAGDSLTGYYRTTTDGTNVVFEYYYEKIATLEESLATGNNERIVPVEGVIYYKDGSYSTGDGENWRPGTGTAFDLKLNFDQNLFKNAKVSGDVLTVKLSAAELAAFIGTDLNAVGEAAAEITIIGENLTYVQVTCTTDNGKLTIKNSYTYTKQDLS